MDSEFANIKLTDISVLATLGVGGFGRVELVSIPITGGQFYLILFLNIDTFCESIRFNLLVCLSLKLIREVYFLSA